LILSGILPNMSLGIAGIGADINLPAVQWGLNISVNVDANIPTLLDDYNPPPVVFDKQRLDDSTDRTVIQCLWCLRQVC